MTHRDDVEAGFFGRRLRKLHGKFRGRDRGGEVEGGEHACGFRGRRKAVCMRVCVERMGSSRFEPCGGRNVLIGMRERDQPTLYLLLAPSDVAGRSGIFPKFALLSVRPSLPFTRPPGTAPPCSPARISTGTTAWYLPPAWEPCAAPGPSRPAPAHLSAQAHGPRAPASRRDPANPRAPRSRSRWTACCSAGCTPTPEMKPPRTKATRKGKAAARTRVTDPSRRERTRGYPGSLADVPAGVPAPASPSRSPRPPSRSPVVSLRPRSCRR